MEGVNKMDDRTQSSQYLGELYEKIIKLGTTMTFDKEILNESIINLWTRLLKIESLTLEDTSVTRPDDKGNFSVLGKSDLLKFGKISLTLDFFSSYDEESNTERLQCIMYWDKAISLWNLKADFPHMPGYIDYSIDKVRSGFQPSYIELMDFLNPVCCISSYDFTELTHNYSASHKIASETIKLGINFSASLDTDESFWATIKMVTGNLGRIDVVGNISDKENEIHFELIHNFNIPYQLSKTFEVMLKRLTLKSGLSKGSIIGPTFTISSELSTLQPALELNIQLDISKNWIMLNSSFKDSHVMTFNDLMASLGLENYDLTHYLPQGYGESYFGNLGLRNLTLKTAISPVQVRELNFLVDTEHPWQIIDDTITVEPSFSVKINRPFDTSKRKTSLEIIGEWMLGKTALTVLALPLSGEISAVMKADQYLDVSALVTQLLPGTNLPELGFSDLNLYGNYLENTFSVGLEAVSEFVMDLGCCHLSVHEVGVHCNYSDKKIQHMDLSGDLNLAGINFNVLGDYQNNSGWNVSGGIQTETEINCKKLINSLMIDLNLTDIQLPDTLPDKYLALDVRSLYINYIGQSKELSAYMDLEKVIELSSGVLIDQLALGIKVMNGSLEEMCVKMLMKVADIDVVLVLKKEKDIWKFIGGTKEKQKIPIGKMIDDLTHKFDCPVEMPSVIRNFTIQDIQIAYFTEESHQEFKFSCKGTIPIDNKELDLMIDFIFNRDGDVYIFTAEGQFIIDKLRFVIEFDHKVNDDFLVASFDPSDKCTMNLQETISGLWDGAKNVIPKSLNIQLEDVFFVLANERTKNEFNGTKIVFGIDIGSHFDLSEIPVVGTLMGKETTIGIERLQGLILTKPMSPTLQKDINKTLLKVSQNKFKMLPETLEASGVYFSAIFDFIDYKPLVEFPILSSKKSENPKNKDELTLYRASKEKTPAEKADQIHWCQINKNIGVLALRKIGVALKGNDIQFHMDISLIASELEMDLIDFWVGINISNPIEKLPSFGIHGLNVAYQQPPIEFDGGLLYIEQPTPDYKWEIDGELMVKYGEYGFFAVASYAQPEVDEIASFFAFLMVSAPIGGSPYLYISGLAGGFGFNRALIVPKANKLLEFPLVQGALGTGDLKSDMKANQALTKMSKYIPPKPSNYWLAAGVAVGSCHIIDAFVMVAGVFGTEFELSVIGVASADVPTGESPELIAHLELGLVGNYNPMKKSIEITGALTSRSYLFMPECKITGGFAYCIWFEKNEFVVTIGGYAPHFHKPKYYPTLERLGINWKVSSHLSMTGGAYFAYTPSCAMAGGNLDMDFKLGPVKAWLTAHADFLMEWLPFHYDVSIGVKVGVSLKIKVLFIHKTIKLEIGANLHMWGPKFSGKVKVDLKIHSFKISFGAGANKKPPKLNWTDFHDALLPNKKNTFQLSESNNTTTSGVININLKDGLIKGIRQDGQADYLIINPNKFAFTTHSAIPSTNVSLNSESLSTEAFNTTFGIRPMGKDRVNVDQTITIKQLRDDKTWSDANLDYINCYLYATDVPEAVWSPNGLKDISTTTVKNVIVGLVIESKDAIYYTLPSVGDVSSKVFLFEPITLTFLWSDYSIPKNQGYEEDSIELLEETIMDTNIQKRREAILSTLNEDGFNLTTNIAMSDFSVNAKNILQSELQLKRLGARKE